MAQCFLYSQASPAGCQLPTRSIHRSSIQLLHLLWCWLVSEKHRPCGSTFLTAWTPKIGLCYCEICVVSLRRGLNCDADLSNTHESVSSPGPLMTKAFLQSFMPHSSLETHVSQEILWDLLQIEFWWPSLSLPKISDISYNSSRYKWDSPWGPSWTRLAV